MNTLDQWMSIENVYTRAPPLVKALVEKPKAKSPPPLVKPSPSRFMDEIHKNEEAFSSNLYNTISRQWTTPTFRCYIVTFTHTLDQIRSYNNAQLISLFCRKLFNYCKLTRVRTEYVIEYTKQNVPHYHALIYFDHNTVNPLWRKKLYNILGNTLIGNISKPEGKYVEDQWTLKRKAKEETKVKTRTREFKWVCDYLAKITSKKKDNWYFSYDHNYIA